jgi:peptide/nickel transport system substrate-binding protein
MKKTLTMVSLFFLCASFLFGNGNAEQAKPVEKLQEAPTTQSVSTPKFGGDLRIVWIPMDTLDVHWTGSDPVWQLGYHIFETVLALDDKSEPIPNLCDWTYSDDHKILTLQVKKGVHFQNGKEMKAEDVISSIKRWLAHSTFGKSAFGDMTSIEMKDDYTVVITLSKPSVTALVALAYQDQGAYVMPKEIIDAAGDGKVTQYIGTGPYKLGEWAPDRYIRLDQYENYTLLGDKPNGYGGAKYAYLDHIYWIPISDMVTQVQALNSGDCKLGIYGATQFDQLVGNQKLKYDMTGDLSSESISFNLKQGLMTDINMRKAVLYALNPDEIMFAACAGKKEFYVNGPTWGAYNTIWESQAGSDVYNHQDLEKSKEYLKKANYNGQVLRVYGNASNDTDKNCALVVAQQLKKAGMNIDLRIVDWATVTQVRTDPTAYEMWINGYVSKPDPSLLSFVGVGWPGWWDTAEKNDLRVKLMTETDTKKRAEVWQQMCSLIWEQLPVIKLGDFRSALFYDKSLKDVPGSYPWRRFYWNTWLDK